MHLNAFEKKKQNRKENETAQIENKKMNATVTSIHKIRKIAQSNAFSVSSSTHGYCVFSPRQK